MLSRFWIVLDDVIYGTVEDHEPRGVTGDNLRQNPGSRRTPLSTGLLSISADPRLTTEHEENVRQQILDGLIADKGETSKRHSYLRQ